ncbi:MAG: PhoPQ-activated pathogenicity-related family protein [Acidobacteriota bacterium]|nr:PhoPQ-activated pathogenicity-related family protein [Acidobacteriota bacterium]
MRFPRALFLAAFVAIFAGIAPAAPRAGKVTGLDKYVNAPDPNYHYELVMTLPGDGYTAYVLDMTSQAWRSPAEVDRNIWKHWLTIIEPNNVKGTTGFLLITGGSTADPAPARADASLVDMAVSTHSVVTELRGIPNEPLTFSEDKKRRTEDQIIAYTWVKFLRTGDETWPLRMPMTKASVRAMDTITAFCGTRQGGGVKVDKFVVGGGSKRGWTTWTTAAVDRRVTAIEPMVIDLLNNVKSFEHHWRAYGFYSPAVKDYQDMGLMDVARTKRYTELMGLVEPYSYRGRYTMPKFIMNAAGDQYFLPDSSRFYFDDLPGEKYLRYVPNTDHSLKNSDARQSLIAFYDAVLHDRPRPKFSWKFEKNGGIRVECLDAPTEVKLWRAANPLKRDFRLRSIGPAYKSTPLEGSGGVYVAKIEKPAKGWTASFVELTFPSGGKYPLKFTTAVRITPDTLPYPKRKSPGRLPE